MKTLRADDVAGAVPVAQVDAVSIVRGRGVRTPETMAAIVSRNLLLINAALHFMPGQSSLAQAEFMHRALSRFAAGGWRRECVLGDCPSRWRGRIEERCFHILQTRDHVLGISAIRQIIAAAKRVHSGRF